ncbi:hypothetical protein MTO96_011292 [Rhipicephalus appendiculatus]
MQSLCDVIFRHGDQEEVTEFSALATDEAAGTDTAELDANAQQETGASSAGDDNGLPHHFDAAYAASEAGDGIGDSLADEQSLFLDADSESACRMRYNKSQIKTRNSVERTFGVWKRRFACLRVKLLTDTDRSAAIITACAALHNIACLRRDPCPLSDEVDPDDDLPDNPSQADPDTVAGAQVRSCYIRRCFSSGNEHTGPVQT